MAWNFYCTSEIRSWAELLDRYHWHDRVPSAGVDKPSRWIFRGQGSAGWDLKTSLERAYEEQAQLCTPGRVSLPEECAARADLAVPQAADLEHFLLRKFQRECHRFDLSSNPAEDDYLEWFAWMQHYGAPTRLLDCTYSMFVAVFFALEDAKANNGPAAVWAVNDEAMRPGFEAVLYERSGSHQWWQYRRDQGLTEKRTFTELFMGQPPLSLVGSVNPFKLNERLVVQQGVFLCPGNVGSSFMKNLEAVVPCCGQQHQPVVIQYRITDDPAVRREILRHLLRMNISSATLFPGLEGFARSLRQWLAFPELALPQNRG